ncbi:hypothetical protein LINGRAHAP2_LOCUS32466 [Linum grandiflorum]
MASDIQKKKTTKQKPVQEPCTKIHSWPNLPDQLICIIAKESNFSTTDRIVNKEWSLMHKISSSTVTKSSRIDSNKSGHSTAMLEPRVKLHNNGFHPIRLNPVIGRGYWNWGGRWKIPDTRILDFLGCTCGFLLTKTPPFSGKVNEEITFWDPFLEMTCFLPEWSPVVPISFAALSSSLRFPPKDGKKFSIAIVLTGISRPAFAFYTWDGRNENNYSWQKRDCEIVDRDGLMKFSNGIWFRRKFYALSLEGTLAVMEEVDSDVKITEVGKKRAVPDSTLKYRECLVESEGRILLVFLVFSRKTEERVEEVQVYRLDIEKLVWVRIRKRSCLGGAALFLGPGCCLSVPAGKLLECRGDCVYFVSGGSCWWVYDVETQVISSCGMDFSRRTDLFSLVST